MPSLTQLVDSWVIEFTEGELGREVFDEGEGLEVDEELVHFCEESEIIGSLDIVHFEDVSAFLEEA